MQVISDIESKCEKDTCKLAENLALIFKEGDIVALNGNLGSGKTFFVKNLCKNYDIDIVTSPTFALVNEYKGAKKIYHFDFYRINKANELFDLGFEDYLNDESAIILIEWADLFKELLPKRFYEVKFAIVDDNLRRIIVYKHE
jgi:tRNA threonylcarbamoyladenosine biosynthesis protein TsaE